MLQHRAGPQPETACAHGPPGWCSRTCVCKQALGGRRCSWSGSALWSRWWRHRCAGSLSPSLQPQGLEPTRLLCLWDFLGRNTAVSCHFLLQGIFPTQGSNASLSCVSCIGRQIFFFYHCATWEAPDVIII